jgi:hypothetical protein
MLVIPKDDVVAGAPLLDEVAFEDQRLQLIGGEQEFHVGDLPYHAAQALAVVAEIAVGEVGLDPLAEGQGLADVQHLALCILEEVDPGGIGKAADFFLEVHVCS